LVSLLLSFFPGVSGHVARVVEALFGRCCKKGGGWYVRDVSANRKGERGVEGGLKEGREG
jgi:hypothetical protein